MYIETNGQRYRCTGTPTLEGDPLRFCLPDGGPEELGGMVGLYTDDGFLLREIDVSGYARHEMAGNTLVITSQPVPVPGPEPAPAEMTLEEATAEMVADHEYRLSLVELGLGGEGAKHG
ncbi:hypothetical protein AAEU42_07295 [Pseudoflavonifractor phocaeensis]|uniref:hypothetical protein n=1 Tax=Pseudoflavonifractor phocaeensis TaxID=1870988 RepID=UPI00313F22A4